jgi:hypothetical protein
MHHYETMQLIFTIMFYIIQDYRIVDIRIVYEHVYCQHSENQHYYSITYNRFIIVLVSFVFN